LDSPASNLVILAVEIPPMNFVLLAVLLGISSFFSMSETVFSSLNPIRIKNFIEEGKKGSKKAFWIHERFDYALTTILVGNNLANVALATVSAGIFTRIFINQETLVTIFNTVVMTTVILIFGEIVPKSFAKRHSETIAIRISGVLFWTMRIMKPVTIVFLKIKKLFLREDARVTISVSESELETIIDTMEEEGSIDEEEAEMLQSVLDLDEKKVYEIMTPRVDMVAIEVNESHDAIVKKFFDHQFSRIPVYENDRDNIIGILNDFPEDKLTPIFIFTLSDFDSVTNEINQLDTDFFIQTFLTDPAIPFRFLNLPLSSRVLVITYLSIGTINLIVTSIHGLNFSFTSNFIFSLDAGEISSNYKSKPTMKFTSVSMGFFRAFISLISFLLFLISFLRVSIPFFDVSGSLLLSIFSNLHVRKFFSLLFSRREVFSM